MTLTDTPIDSGDIDLSDSSSVKSVIAGDQPEISPPEDPIVELPRGIWHEGAWQTKVELNELTGEDEERFTRFKDEELFRTILAAGVRRIGSIDLNEKSLPEQEQIIQSLLLGEQMMLLINIVRVTFGNEREFNWNCQHCESDNTTTLILSEDFPVTVPDGIREAHVFTDSKGDKIVFSPVCGVHLQQVKPGMSQGAVNSILLEQVITEINDQRPFNLGEAVKKMNLRDRRALLAELIKVQPEVDMNLTIKCALCGEEQTSALTWADLFRI